MSSLQHKKCVVHVVPIKVMYRKFLSISTLTYIAKKDIDCALRSLAYIGD
jgi:hypothetical protein